MPKKIPRKPKQVTQPVIEAVPTPAAPSPVQEYAEFFKEQVKGLHKQTMYLIQQDISYYQVEGGIPPHTLVKIDAILSATDLEHAKELALKAQRSGNMYCLGTWAKGDARGPRTKEFVLKEVRKEEGMAKSFDSRGLHAAADKHMERARELWEEYKRMGLI